MAVPLSSEFILDHCQPSLPIRMAIVCTHLPWVLAQPKKKSNHFKAITRPDRVNRCRGVDTQVLDAESLFEMCESDRFKWGGGACHRRISTPRPLSTDHELNRPRKLMPSSGG